MTNIKVEPRESVRHETKVSPADRLVSELPGTYYKLSEAAKIVGVSPTTLRRLLRKQHTGLKAPSFQIQQGEMLMYLYSTDDIKELREYYSTGRIPQERTA